MARDHTTTTGYTAAPTQKATAQTGSMSKTLPLPLTLLRYKECLQYPEKKERQKKRLPSNPSQTPSDLTSGSPRVAPPSQSTSRLRPHRHEIGAENRPYLRPSTISARSYRKKLANRAKSVHAKIMPSSSSNSSSTPTTKKN